MAGLQFLACLYAVFVIMTKRKASHMRRVQSDKSIRETALLETDASEDGVAVAGDGKAPEVHLHVV